MAKNTADNPYSRAGQNVPEVANCDHSERDEVQTNVVKMDPRKGVPHDRLPTKGIFNLPPGKSLYHTERAQCVRERAQTDLPEELKDAMQTLVNVGMQRSNQDYADVADHNAMTLAFALKYAACDLYVVDSHAIDPKTGKGTGKTYEGTWTAKIPRGSKWQQRACKDSVEIVSFWTGDGEYPETKAGTIYPFASVGAPRNVSIVFPEGEDVWVLDIDGNEGKENLAKLEAEYGPLPKTPKSITGSGGWHFLFRSKRQHYNTASKVAPNIDVRGQGGQVIAAPSIHESGNFYQWAEGRAPWECEIAEAPEWLDMLVAEASNKTEEGNASNAKHHKTSKWKAGGRSAAAKARDSEARGFQTILATIGDHDGGAGFDSPINRAACSWFSTNGTDMVSSELFDTLRAQIDEAERDPERDRSKYDTDEYLTERIEKARAHIAEERTKQEAEPFDMAAPLGDGLKDAIATLDRGFKYVNIGGEGRFLRVLVPGEKPKIEVWNTTALTNWYANRKVVISTTDAQGIEVEEEINPVPLFFNQAQRWSGTAFAPPPASVGQNVYNLFRGFTVQPESGDCTMLKDFIQDIICGGDAEVFMWVWHWMAHMVQRPGEKPKTSLVYWGEGGTGKGTFGRLLRALVHPYGTTFGCADDVVGRWAGQRHALNIVGVSEEAVFSGNRRETNQLKHKTDAEEITVEVKNIQPIEMPSFMRYCFDSNHSDAMHIEGNGSERRYCVLHVSNARKGDLEYFKLLREQIDGDGIKALSHELMTYDPAHAGMQWSDVFTAPVTSDRTNMERETMRPVHRAFARMIEDGEFVHKDGSETYRFDLTEGQTRIPKYMLRAFVEKHGDSRQAAETEPERVFERLFGVSLVSRRARCKCFYRRAQDHDIDEWEGKDLNVQAYELPAHADLLAVLGKSAPETEGSPPTNEE
jgi:hypothetical protein